MADQKFETMTGRIYRIAPKGYHGKKAAAHNPSLKSSAAAVKALQSPNLATRYLAWQALHKMGEKAEPALRKVWQASNEFSRARAWELLARINGKEQQYLDAAIADKDPNIRNLALRYVRVEKKDPVSVVKRLVKDPSPQVRRECALCLHMNKSAEAPDLWADLAEQHDGKDRWYLEALGIGAFQQDDRFFDAWFKRVGDSWNTPAGRDIVWRIRSSKTPELIVKIIQDKNTPKPERDRFFRALDFVKGPAKDAALVQLLAQ
jgi:HEAT repeat protein